jgi:hypothetical protein
MKTNDELFDPVTKLDHPMARKLKELRTEAFKLPTTSDAEKYLSEWKKNNPEEATAMREFIMGIEIEYKESRRKEIKSKLGYSRIGRNNV